MNLSICGPHKFLMNNSGISGCLVELLIYLCQVFSPRYCKENQKEKEATQKTRKKNLPKRKEIELRRRTHLIYYVSLSCIIKHVSCIMYKYSVAMASHV